MGMFVFVTIFTVSVSLAIAAAAVLAPITSGLPWSYEGLGSELWPGIRKPCGGQHQSPINIIRDQVKLDPTLGRIKLLNYNGAVQPTAGWTLTNNNGITVQLTGNFGPYKIAIAGGGLPHSYTFQQLHFHWGNGDNPGAEHLMDFRRYAAELHIVHARNRTAAERRALNSTQMTETQVLAVLIDVGPNDNAAFEPILSVINQVPRINETTTIHQTIAFQDLLPNHGQNPAEDLAFYRYVGSLTIPDCNEGIIWTILQKTILLSERQLVSLQTVLNGHNKRHNRIGGEHDHLVNNFRLVQPLNGRVVTANKLPTGISTAQPAALSQRSEAGFARNIKFDRFNEVFNRKKLAAASRFGDESFAAA